MLSYKDLINFHKDLISFHKDLSKEEIYGILMSLMDKSPLDFQDKVLKSNFSPEEINEILTILKL